MNKKIAPAIQSLLFKTVQDSLPTHRSLVDELAELLNLSIDSVYRRLRNDKILSIHETDIICREYSISFDALSKNQLNAVVCNYALLRNEADLKNHLFFMKQEISLFSKMPESHITYAAIDIPLFHHFQFHELSAFKVFYWLRSVINDKDYVNKKFSPSIVSTELMNEYKQMFEMYRKCRVTEIWTDSTIRSLIKQIEFFWESGMFRSKNDALLICQQAEQEILNIQSLAEKNIHPQDQQYYKLYFSEIEIGNNSILAQSGSIRRAYLTYNTINVLVNSHESFCKEIEAWQQNLIRKSTLISGASEKIRYQFFKRVLDEVSALRDKILGN